MKKTIKDLETENKELKKQLNEVKVVAMKLQNRCNIIKAMADLQLV